MNFVLDSLRGFHKILNKRNFLSIMSKRNLFIVQENETSTFEFDEKLEKLPLPKLEDTLERYYQSLLPFGELSELENSRRVIDEFKNGIGKKLHEILKEKASKERNWVEKYWEDYAYLTNRTPFPPYCTMAQPLLTSFTGMKTTPENMVKNLSRIVYYSLEYWNLIRQEKVRPAASADGKIHFSSDQYKRIFNTVRIPGDEKDEISCHFKLNMEGQCPSQVVVVGYGRIFYFDVIHDGRLMSSQEINHTLTEIYEKIKNEVCHMGVPVLTADDRTAWSKNRKHLMEISKENENYFKIIESAILVISIDRDEPVGVSDLSQKSLDGDIHSRWNDKSMSLVAFKNGLFGATGEHSCCDGTVSISPYVLVNLMEEPEPDWSKKVDLKVSPVEINFKIDEKIKSEIDRLVKHKELTKNQVTVHFNDYTKYGKNRMKEQNVHPDSFVQMAIQLAHYKLHGKIASTYETATMRAYYHGRTETVRSCTIDVMNWIEKMMDEKVTPSEKAKYFKTATHSQLKLMNEAKEGKGVDRHLFALSCIAYENNIPMPELYSDPLFLKSGGGGNFVLSTSTMGYFINIGFVAPMLKDGYGAFYTMLEDRIWIIFTAYRDSQVSSCKKFYDAFEESMDEIMEMMSSLRSGKM